ncbi:YcnI family copper-binding membrane protein [Methylophaga sp.]|uniref:YcnI family copper-binding membrane protein n=1 Tax=Methylophaga sp. TaxID=2024840 RepID=UPI003F69B49C
MKKIMFVALLAIPAIANAHAVFQQPEVTSGSYYKATLGIGHGCEGATTTQISIEIPEGIQYAKPMAKPGWEIDIVKKTLTKPYDSHGKTVTEDVSVITWYGGQLEDNFYDEFVFKAKVAAEPQTLYLPVRQTCITGENYWHEIPEADKQWHDYEKPAPFLDIKAPSHANHH